MEYISDNKNMAHFAASYLLWQLPDGIAIQPSHNKDTEKDSYHALPLQSSSYLCSRFINPTYPSSLSLIPTRNPIEDFIH